MTISQSLEYKEWNYVTGDIVKQYMIDLSGISDEQQDHSDESDIDQDSSDEEDSDDAMNPQGDESVGGAAGSRTN